MASEDIEFVERTLRCVRVRVAPRRRASARRARPRPPSSIEGARFRPPSASSARNEIITERPSLPSLLLRAAPARSWLDAHERACASAGTDPDAAPFVPTTAQAEVAKHLAHRLDLARVVSRDLDAQIASTTDALARIERVTAAAESVRETDERRARFAREGGADRRAALPMGADADAAPSPHAADWRTLARELLAASEDPQKTEAYAAALRLRKRLGTDELLGLGG